MPRLPTGPASPPCRGRRRRPASGARSGCRTGRRPTSAPRGTRRIRRPPPTRPPRRVRPCPRTPRGTASAACAESRSRRGARPVAPRPRRRPASSRRGIPGGPSRSRRRRRSAPRPRDEHQHEGCIHVPHLRSHRSLRPCAPTGAVGPATSRLFARPRETRARTMALTGRSVGMTLGTWLVVFVVSAGVLVLVGTHLCAGRRPDRHPHRRRRHARRRHPARGRHLAARARDRRHRGDRGCAFARRGRPVRQQHGEHGDPRGDRPRRHDAMCCPRSSSRTPRSGRSRSRSRHWPCSESRPRSAWRSGGWGSTPCS